MSNEELVTLIQEGKNEYIPELWERVYRLIYKWAMKYCDSINGTSKYGIDDLVQSGYFAVLNALNDYTEAKGYKFTTYLFYHCKNEFRAVLGIHTSKREISTVSLDESLTEDDDFTLGDTIRDESAEEAFDDIDDILYQEYCHERLSCAIDTLPQVQQQVINLRYYDALTYSEIGNRLSYSKSYIQMVEKNALRNLRKDEAYRYLQEFDERPKKPKDVDMYSGSLRSWRNTGISSTERAVYERMKLKYINERSSI